MIIETILNYLTENIDKPVYSQIPQEAPADFVIIDKVGGSVSDHINSSTIAVQSYGNSLLAAAELNENVKEKMVNLIENDKIASVKITGDTNFADLAKKKDRYQSVFEIKHY